MKKFLKRIFPVLLAALIIVSIGWYLLEYDPAFTRDVLLHQARNFEENGNHTTAVWLYNLAYTYFGGNDDVAIELAENFKEIGNYTKAEYTLRKAIEDGGSVEVYMALSRTYVEQGKLRDAVLMLENVSGEMKEKLEALRPAAPQASLPSGSYQEYLSVELTSPGNTIYVAFDNDYPSNQSDAYLAPIQLSSGETTLFALSIGENGLVSKLSVYSYLISDVVEIVTFADAGFEAALRQQLGHGPDSVLYSNTLWEVTELTLGQEVIGCADLKWLPNLQKLTVTGASLEGADALALCTQLQSLSITGSALSTDILEAVSTLTNLTQLQLTECSISSIAPLAKLTGLNELDLSKNAIRDIAPLAGLKKLTKLDLSSNALINLQGLEQLLELKYLDVSFNSIVSTAPLATLSALEELNISSNALRSLDSIENLTQLKKLYAAYNELLGLEELETCLALTHLDVSHNTLLNVDIAARLTALEELDFSHNEVSLLPEFTMDCALRVINGEYNQLGSLKRLGGLKNLAYIYMNYNTEISSVKALVDCPALLEVHIYGTMVRNVSVLTDKFVKVVYSPV